MRAARTLLALFLTAILLGAPAVSGAPGKGRGGEREAATLSSSSMTLAEGGATLVVVVNATGADAAFPFDATGGEGLPARFTLTTVDGAARISFAGLRANHTYALSESAPAGWNLTGAACTEGVPARVVIAANATVTCTFDYARLGDLLVVVNATGGDATLPFLASGLPAAFNLTTVNGTASRLFHATPNVTLSLAPQVPAGWNLTAAACSEGAPANLTLTRNATTTCRFEMTRLNTLLVRVNALGGDATLPFNATGALPASFQLATSGGAAVLAFADLPAGGYALAPLTPAGWSLAAASCSEGTPANLTLTAGRHVTCTFNLTREGALTLVVLARGGDGLFPFATSGPSLPPAFNVATVNGTGVQVFPNVTTGAQHGLVMTAPPGWRHVASACTNGTPANFTLAAGGAVTCTFELTRLAEVRGLVYHDADRDAHRDANESGLAGLRVWLDRDNDGAFDADEPSTLTNATGRYALVDLPAGAYALRIAPAAGWFQVHPAAAHALVLADGASLDAYDFALAAHAAAPREDKDEEREARGPGFWKNWDKHGKHARADLDAWMRAIDATSAWLMPSGYNASADGLAALLKDGSKSCNRTYGHLGCAQRQLETRLLVLRLNVMAGHLAESDTVEVKRDAAAYLGLGERATVKQLVDAVEAKAGTSPTRDQFHLMRHAVSRAVEHDD